MSWMGWSNFPVYAKAGYKASEQLTPNILANNLDMVKKETILKIVNNLEEYSYIEFP